MNTRYLEALHAVAAQGSIAAAARLLDLSPAALSEQLHALERELEAALLVRQGRAVALTAAGHAVAEASREPLLRLRELRQVAQLDMPRGNLVVGCISTAMISLMPPTMRRLARDMPDVGLRVVPGTSDQLMHMLQGGEIDCAILVAPPWRLPKTFVWHVLRRERLQLLSAFPPGSQGIADCLASHPFIRMDRRSWTGHIVSRFLEDERIAIKESFELDGLEAIRLLVAERIGVALTPDWQRPGGAGFTHDRVVHTDITDPRYERIIGMLSPAGPKDPLVRVLVATILAS